MEALFTVELTGDEISELLDIVGSYEPESHYGDPDHPLRTVQVKLDAALTTVESAGGC
jgi:hypothetical protein